MKLNLALPHSKENRNNIMLLTHLLAQLTVFGTDVLDIRNDRARN